jgi:hypothetical protein
MTEGMRTAATLYLVPRDNENGSGQINKIEFVSIIIPFPEMLKL